MSQAVRRTPHTAGDQSSRLDHFHMGFVVDEMESRRFLSVYLPFSPAINLIPPFYHTHLIHFVSFHFLRPCDSASCVGGRKRFYSKTFNKGASSHLIPEPDPVWDSS